MKQNKKKLIIIISILLALLIAILITILIINNNHANEKTTTKKDNTIEKNSKKDESVKFSNEDLEKYINYINPVSIGPSSLIYDTDFIDVDKMSMKDKISYVGSLVYSKHTTSDNYEYDIINESDVKKIIEEVYGPNTYERTTFNLGCGDYILNGNEEKYYSRTGCGGISSEVVVNIITDYSANKNKLEITTNYVFLDGMTNKLYKDLKLESYLNDFNEYDSIDEIKENMKKYVLENKDKLSSMVYTFESTDGINYYFKKFKNKK